MSRAVVWFPLAEACMVPLAEAFNKVTPQGPLDPVSEVHDVFGNRGFLLTSQGQPRAVAI